MNRIEFNCDKCKSGYIVSFDSRYAKKCRVCEGIAKEEGIELDSPNVQSAIDKAVDVAVARSEKRAKERYDAELAKELAKSAKTSAAKPASVPADGK